MARSPTTLVDTTQLYSIKDRLNATGATASFEYTQTALGMTGRTQQGVGRDSMSREPDGTPLLQRKPNGGLRYLSLNHQGSVTGITGLDGQRYATFRYAPYGQFINQAGSESNFETQLVGFQGGFFHRTHADYKFGHRWNITGIGGWTQPDPIGTPGSSGSGQDNRSGIGGPYSTELNAYNFANNNPSNNTDPTGLYTDEQFRADVGFIASSGAIGGVLGGLVGCAVTAAAGCLPGVVPGAFIGGVFGTGYGIGYVVTQRAQGE